MNGIDKKIYCIKANLLLIGARPHRGKINLYKFFTKIVEIKNIENCYSYEFMFRISNPINLLTLFQQRHEIELTPNRRDLYLSYNLKEMKYRPVRVIHIIVFTLIAVRFPKSIKKIYLSKKFCHQTETEN